MPLMREGSTRVMVSTGEPGTVAMHFQDSWSVFDRGPSRQLIPGMGAARCACAVKSFKLAAEAGVKTHFLSQEARNVIHVMEFTAAKPETLSDFSYGRVLPLEWIWRGRVFGSLLARLESGALDKRTLGFAEDTKVTRGTKLPKLILECTTKFEPVDRHLTDEEARTLARLSKKEWESAQELVRRFVRRTNERYEEVGYECPDGKLVLVDVGATPDENRILQQGTEKMYCKDLIRDYLKQTPWYPELQQAKAACPDDPSRWPAYPELPDDLVQRVAARYKQVALHYAGVHVG